MTTTSQRYVLHLLILFLTAATTTLTQSLNDKDFVNCFTSSILHSSSCSFNSTMHSPDSPSYSYLLHSAQQNPRWLNNSQPPLFIIAPYTTHEIRAAVTCCRRHDLQIRVKSGGHDYEGLSYRCKCNAIATPFVIIDLVNFRSISIRLEDETAWVQSGATLGELYYSIALQSRAHGFPAGLCPSVGVGGHFSGGGFGTLLRKHGLAADNILDAYLMDANGKILDRESMGEDLFWAIRGGGGTSFGIILAWKIKLVRVPPVVTVFTIRKNDLQSIHLINKWQFLVSSNKLPEDLFIRIVMQRIDGGISETLFNSLFLGATEGLIPVMKESFPELGLEEKDCVEMSWIESVLYFAGFDRGERPEVLLDRTVQYKSYFKAKSDFVEKPIPEVALQGIEERLAEAGAGAAAALVIMDPFGGRMERIPGGELPFPHRKGNLFNVQYLVKWNNANEGGKQYIKWIRELYKYMKPYVSSSPRAAYINYRDLDLGVNLLQQQKITNSSSHSPWSCSFNYNKGRKWGIKYFKGNFKRLAWVKKRVDPGNFFRNEQSIPLYP